MLPSIRVQLLGAFALNLLLLLGLGYFSITQIEHLHADTTFLGRNITPAIDLASQITNVASRYREAQAEYAFTTNPSRRTELTSQFNDLENQMDTIWKGFTPIIDAPQARTQFTKLRTSWLIYVSQAHNAFQGLATDSSQRLQTSFYELQPSYNEVLSATSGFAHVQTQKSQTSITRSNTTYSGSRLFIMILTGVAIVFAIVLGLVISTPLIRHIQTLTTTTALVSNGDLTPNVTIRRKDELGQLAHGFNHMITGLRTAQREVEEYQQTLEQRVETRTAELQHTLKELQATLRERDLLNTTVRELSNPVIPLLQQIVVMPLIGIIDSGRAGVLMESLLRAVEEQKAHIIILDITGVPLVDTQVAQILIRATQAAKLLGAQTIMVGIRPEIAQTLVGLNIEFVDMITRSNLQEGVITALKQQGRYIAHQNAKV